MQTWKITVVCVALIGGGCSSGTSMDAGNDPSGTESGPLRVVIRKTSEQPQVASKPASEPSTQATEGLPGVSSLPGLGQPASEEPSKSLRGLPGLGEPPAEDRVVSPGSFAGEWFTSFGVIDFEVQGEQLRGTVRSDGASLEGSVQGRTATLTYKGNSQGSVNLELDESNLSFEGSILINNRRRPWNGWRPDPDANNRPKGDLGGLWLTSQGLMELTQSEDQVEGVYAIQGTSSIDGTIDDHRLDFEYQGFRGGSGWFTLSDDGETLHGAAHGEGSTNWFAWSGRRAPEYVRHAALVPGQIVDGSTSTMLTYHVRAPDAYDPNADPPQSWPTVLILHGSNMSGKAYVNTIAQAFPEIGRDYLLLGINGERPSATGDEPRFNYSYVSYVGKSTFRGFPGTDRESPALVSEALAELTSVYPIDHVFVGGHSQGGFLTYSLLMNFPEQFVGAFPISAGVIFQCDPNVFEDESLQAAQRSTPLAIIHSRSDNVVSYGMGESANELFGEAGWPAFRFFNPQGGGHAFALLPIDQAIRWLEAHHSDDPDALIAFAERASEEGQTRDAVAAIRRARALDPNPDQVAALERLAEPIDAEARQLADRFLPMIHDGQSGPWVEEFLQARDRFEFADGFAEAMAAFQVLRDQHEGPAREANNAARQSFQQSDRSAGFTKYQKIVDKYFASPLYRQLKRQLDQRG